jgi:hypothetical protein
MIPVRSRREVVTIYPQHPIHPLLLDTVSNYRPVKHMIFEHIPYTHIDSITIYYQFYLKTKT